VAAAREKRIDAAVHDPVVKAGDHHGLIVCNDLAAVLKDADAAVLLTEHKSYRAISPKTFAQSMRGRLIADGRNWLNHAELRGAGFEVIVLGMGSCS